jgi:hypothetical protein
LGVLEALLWRSNSSLALSEHGARSSLYDEAKAIVKKHKATPEEVEVQLDQYRQDGIPDEKRFNGKKGSFLISTCMLLFASENFILSPFSLGSCIFWYGCLLTCLAPWFTCRHYFLSCFCEALLEPDFISFDFK